jgi:hypothetical protein
MFYDDERHSISNRSLWFDDSKDRMFLYEKDKKKEHIIHVRK